jgi:hypothetical protein
MPRSARFRCTQRTFLGREPGRVADVSEDQSGDDRPDAVQLEQTGLRRGDCVADPGLIGGELAVESAYVREEIAGDPFTFDGDEALECAPRSTRAARSAVKRRGAPATSSEPVR